MHAKHKDIGYIDVFARERMRLVLDSTEGWGYRLQFLDIPMRKEEQLAFIERYGSRLELLIEEQKEDIDRKLNRIEFLHDCNKPCRGANFLVALNKPYAPEELGHFRVLLSVMDLNERDPHPTLWFGARDGYSIWHSAGKETSLFGVKTLVWSRNPDQEIQNTLVGGSGEKGDRIDAWGHIYQRGPFPTLGSLDQKIVNVFVTEPLVNKIDSLVTRGFRIGTGE